MTMEHIKGGLVGKTIQDVGLINRSGEKHARITLCDKSILFVPISDVMITVSEAPRKPAGSVTLSGRAVA